MYCYYRLDKNTCPYKVPLKKKTNVIRNEVNKKCPCPGVLVFNRGMALDIQSA